MEGLKLPREKDEKELPQVVDNSLDKAKQRKEEPGQAEKVCVCVCRGEPDHKGPECHGPATGTELTEVP